MHDLTMFTDNRSGAFGFDNPPKFPGTVITIMSYEKFYDIFEDFL